MAPLGVVFLTDRNLQVVELKVPVERLGFAEGWVCDISVNVCVQLLAYLACTQIHHI